MAQVAKRDCQPRCVALNVSTPMHDPTRRQRIEAIKMSLVMSIERLNERGVDLTALRTQRRIMQDVKKTVTEVTEGEFRTAVAELQARTIKTGDDPHFSFVLKRLVE